MRVVLDTNTLVSALLFSGTTARLVPLWQTGRIAVLISREILEEYIRTLSYPKFKLSDAEVKALVEEEILPFATTVTVNQRLKVVKRDPDDDKFLECSVAGKAEYLVSGDQDLLALKTFQGVAILSPAEFLKKLGE